MFFNNLEDLDTFRNQLLSIPKLVEGAKLGSLANSVYLLFWKDFVSHWDYKLPEVEKQNMQDVAAKFREKYESIFGEFNSCLTPEGRSKTIQELGELTKNMNRISETVRNRSTTDLVTLSNMMKEHFVKVSEVITPATAVWFHEVKEVFSLPGMKPSDDPGKKLTDTKPLPNVTRLIEQYNDELQCIQMDLSNQYTHAAETRLNILGTFKDMVCEVYCLANDNIKEQPDDVDEMLKSFFMNFDIDL